MMVVNPKKQEVKRFVKWLCRNKFQIMDNAYCVLLTEEDMLKLVERYWNETN